MLKDTTKTSAHIEIGRRHPYAVLFGPGLFGAVLVVAVLVVAALGVRWLFGHLSAPNVSVPIGAPFGLIALAVVGCVAITLLVRRIVRHIRYGV